MEVSRGKNAEYERGDGARFTGGVWLAAGHAAPDGTSVGIVHFSPGARTHWHRHPGGQFLFGLAGRGRVRSRGEAGSILLPGDVAHIPPDEWHYHGGDAGSPLTHVAVNGRGSPDWGDPVTDAEFGESF
jgi:quercetin dioxygenase-like cupin family protein